ncbi:hypothetical protein JOF29_001933 [Kribbella aluminosa]|uniref:Uncharacterized protein n=1 Tax=Kribbella aluminosa TaxID=416017 RepID=A0ABS4UGV1_9ACTN|nr:hypothetical protein [Kribbella aluminosa]MBP2350850.1 hypothetical protein [Kribbella aluminosa]
MTTIRVRRLASVLTVFNHVPVMEGNTRDEQGYSHFVPRYTFSFADRTAPDHFGFPPGYRAGAYHSSELPEWARFHGGGATQSFQLGGITQISLSRQHHCGFWSQLAGS